MVDSNPTTGSKRLLIIERSRIYRELLTCSLNVLDWLDIVHAAEDLNETENLFATLKPDIVLVGVPIPGYCVTDWARELKSRYAESRVVFLSYEENSELARSAIEVGVDGYVHADTSLDALTAVIKAVADGDHVYDNSTSRLIQEWIKYPPRPSVEPRLLHNLSAREQEIAELLADGLTNQEIAEKAFVSVNTVKTHLRRIYQRLGISSRRELVRSLKTA